MSNIDAVLKLEVPRTNRNILKTFRSATVEELKSGREWYRRALALSEELTRLDGQFDPYDAQEVDHQVSRAAAVIAVLSPRLNWSKNVELARKVYADAKVMRTIYDDRPDEYRGARENLVATFPGLKSNGDKAYRILIDGEDPEDVVSGPKVTAFWRTIVNPSDPRAVVVDRHALDVAVGKVLDDRQRGIILGRKGAYEELSALYRRAAKTLSKESYGVQPGSVKPPVWTPAEVQAVTWVVWRRTHAANKFAAQKEEL